MRGAYNGWGARCVITGLLLVTGSTPLLADPIVRPDTVLEEGAFRPDSMLPVVQDALQEVRRTAPKVSPTMLGIDDGYLVNGGLLHTELREMEIPGRSARVKRAANGGPDIFSEVVDDALRATRDALFDSTDTANLSLGGVELSLSLSGDRRVLSVNGVELAASDPQADQANEAPIVLPATTDVVDHAQVRVAGDTELLTVEGLVARIRRFVSHPLTIMATIALAGIWLLLLVAQSSRSRRE